tara:strand:- start:2582 stop:2992 length:411 start_codon:yes stop_codon:yes gene_type:complete
MELSNGVTELENLLIPVYAAFSKDLLYARETISSYVSDQGFLPLTLPNKMVHSNPDKIDENLVRQSNNTLVALANELWVFGPVSDSVRARIRLAEEQEKPVRYFDVVSGVEIVELAVEKVRFAEGSEEYRERTTVG